jgi:hypothetical protein
MAHPRNSLAATMSHSPVILNSKTIDRTGSVFCVERLWRNKLSASDLQHGFERTTTRNFRLIAVARVESRVRDRFNFGIPKAAASFSNSFPFSENRHMPRRRCRFRPGIGEPSHVSGENGCFGSCTRDVSHHACLVVSIAGRRVSTAHSLSLSFSFTQLQAIVAT